jgi:hypothetical protein
MPTGTLGAEFSGGSTESRMFIFQKKEEKEKNRLGRGPRAGFDCRGPDRKSPQTAEWKKAELPKMIGAPSVGLLAGFLEGTGTNGERLDTQV